MQGNEPLSVLWYFIHQQNVVIYNGSENMLTKHKEYALNEQMIISFAEVQCKIKLIKAKDANRTSKSVQQKTGKEKIKSDIMKMFEVDQENSELNQTVVNRKQKVEEKPAKDEF